MCNGKEWIINGLQNSKNKEHYLYALQLLFQNFDGNPFRFGDVRSFLERKRVEEGMNHNFYQSSVYRALTLAGNGLHELYKRGILEKKPVDRHNFYYRFVPEPLIDLGLTGDSVITQAQ